MKKRPTKLRRAAVVCLLAVVSLSFFSADALAGDEAAAAHYKKGRNLYNVSEYRAALDEFKQAYVLHEDPAFLYNIAQCHRMLGNHREAITFYKRFLNESPRAPNRKEIERLIAELETKAAEAPRPPPAPPVADRVVRAEEAAPPPPASAPTAAASPAPTPASAPPATPPATRAGFHLELGLGVGILHDQFDWLGLTKGKATGGSGAFQLAATHGVLPTLALGLVLAGESVQSPHVEVSGTTTNNVSVGTLNFLGALADWRPRPGSTGLHVELAVGGARMNVKDQAGVVAQRNPAGGGGLLGAGCDWALGDTWKWGLLARFVAVTLDDQGTTHNVVALSALLALGYR